jgi:cytochrome o ubiquinol oxidase operon protein cyoD
MQDDRHVHNDLAHDDFLDGTHFALKGYLGGFAAAALLTAIPFWLVMTGAISNLAVAAAVIVGLAIAQILLHTFAFLHVNARAQGGWTLVAYVFTGVLVLITIGGSLWIMNHLNHNMMPGVAGAAADNL